MHLIRRQDLIDYAAGDLTGTPAERVERHLEQSPAARRLVDRYRSVAELRATDDSEAPPATAVARAKAVFKRVPEPLGAEWPARVREIVASIVWDSRLQPAAVRRAGATGFQLAAEAEEENVAVDLDFTRRDDAGPVRWRIVGQVDPAPATRAIAELHDVATGETLAVDIDEHGQFDSELHGGEWNLSIHAGASVMMVGPISLE